MTVSAHRGIIPNLFRFIYLYNTLDAAPGCTAEIEIVSELIYNDYKSTISAYIFRM